jgi:late competence protein required for DNA uptake (superfamily II DNA/RNA helicase)
MNDDEIYQKLVILLKLFKNRPYHLAKYLVDNSALNKAFLNKISKSTKLDELLNNDEEINKSLPIYFTNITQMEQFYESLLEEIKELKKNKPNEDISQSLNYKLDQLIKDEKFEEAAKLRDYMEKNSIKRINKN